MPLQDACLFLQLMHGEAKLENWQRRDYPTGDEIKEGECVNVRDLPHTIQICL